MLRFKSLLAGKKCYSVWHFSFVMISIDLVNCKFWKWNYKKWQKMFMFLTQDSSLETCLNSNRFFLSNSWHWVNLFDPLINQCFSSNEMNWTDLTDSGTHREGPTNNAHKYRKYLSAMLRGVCKLKESVSVFTYRVQSVSVS